ncbi:VirK/YbjX family protein [Chitinimonas sp. BJB300]|uniref:VirK/YbjX family protein n=1 Tax=Chitinimonas sp. BJB300 TaxID=1559339 RepID=UPI000C0C7B5F|nr:DUF535 family protein [Chitinimonas sp. BJB300]PHV10951.1 hypothetical protein CSQ89_13380 [Chitinimonas sp. BJB300]TSJ89886.1 DUF535 domain-containing protein [Chitinimonas sp. BJB300]
MMPIIRTSLLLAQPGRLLGGKHIWKYLFRSLAHHHHAMNWARYIQADARLTELAASQPHILLKLQRPYLRANVPTADKLNWLCDHYYWMLAYWPWDFVQVMYRQGEVELARIGAQENHYRILLGPAERCSKEGELVLYLERNGETLAFLAFSVHQCDKHWTVNIGCLQGPSPEMGLELVKTATKELHGLRPKQAILVALYALMRHQGVERTIAASNRTHIYQHSARHNQRITADYDSFWQEMGGVATETGFDLPTQLWRKSVAEIASKKRAQYRRRHELEDQMVSAIRAALPLSSKTTPIKTVSIFHEHLEILDQAA